MIIFDMLVLHGVSFLFQVLKLNLVQKTHCGINWWISTVEENWLNTFMILSLAINILKLDQKYIHKV